jgi:hypothetical protein
MPTYAQNTSVSVDKSKAEIERTLSRFGASHFGYAWKEGTAIIEFAVNERRIRFNMKLPMKIEERFAFRKAYGKLRPNEPAKAEKLWEQECRSNWRALALLVKAKLSAVEAGITTFEEEFLSHTIIVPEKGKKATTVAEWLLPQVNAQYENGGNLPPLLTSGGR